MLSHEDLDHGIIEPLNLADYLQTYSRIEAITQIVFGLLGIFLAHWAVWLLYLPMTIYNLFRLRQDGFRYTFMFLNEYTKIRKGIERAQAIKLIWYLIMMVIALFMFIYTLAMGLGDL